MPNYGLWQRWLPAISASLLVICLGLPLPLRFGLGLFPLLSLIAVYYWTLFRPGSLPYLFLFLLGLAQDILTAMPLGLTSFILLAARMLLLSRRQWLGFAHFWIVWRNFVPLAALACLVYWLGASLVNDGLMPAAPMVAQWLLTALCYPLLHWLLAKISAYVPSEARD